jgi:hypothetical protein
MLINEKESGGNYECFVYALKPDVRSFDSFKSIFEKYEDRLQALHTINQNE